MHGEVTEVVNRTLRTHHTNVRGLQLMSWRTNTDAILHEISEDQISDLCEVADEKNANAMLTLAKTSSELQNLRSLWPDANEAGWSEQLRDAAHSAAEEEKRGRAGVKI